MNVNCRKGKKMLSCGESNVPYLSLGGFMHILVSVCICSSLTRNYLPKTRTATSLVSVHTT